MKNMRYIDPMKETPIGKLLGEVRLLKAKVEGKDKNLADNYPPYDKVTRGDIIAAVKGKKGKVKSKPKKDEAGSYKSDRGEKIGKGSDDDKMGCKGAMCKDDDCPTCMKKAVEKNPALMALGGMAATGASATAATPAEPWNRTGCLARSARSERRRTGQPF